MEMLRHQMIVKILRKREQEITIDAHEVVRFWRVPVGYYPYQRKPWLVVISGTRRYLTEPEAQDFLNYITETYDYAIIKRTLD